MNQSTKVSVQKGGGSEKAGKEDKVLGLDSRKRLDFLIDTAMLKWVESHPEQMNRYSDEDFIRELFRSSKVIYL